MRKRILAVILAGILCMGFLPADVSADESHEVHEEEEVITCPEEDHKETGSPETDDSNMDLPEMSDSETDDAVTADHPVDGPDVPEKFAEESAEEEQTLLPVPAPDLPAFRAKDNGILTRGMLSPDYFDFIEGNVSGEGVVNGNTFHYISDTANPVSEENELKLTKATFDSEADTGALISTDTYDNGSEDLTLFLLDLSSLAGGEPSANGKVEDTRLDQALQGEGSAFDDVGTIMFHQAGMIHGRYVDVALTFNRIRLYNAYGEEFGSVGYPSAQNGHVGLKDNKICFAMLSSSHFSVGENYCRGVQAKNERYTSDYYTYPCCMDLDVDVSVRYHDDHEIADDVSYLAVVSDVDIYFNRDSDWETSSNSDSLEQFLARRGIYAETYQTVSGFTGDYYIYPDDLDCIYSGSTGVVTVQATLDTENAGGAESGTAGRDSYTEAGLYADTNGGSWAVRYKAGWCSSVIEIYDYTVNDIVINKVDAEDHEKTLPDAGFSLYAEQEDSENVLHRYYYSGYDDVNHCAVWTEAEKELQTGEFQIPEEAGTLTTDRGKAEAYGLAPGKYFLEEITAPEGYHPLDHAIPFTITTYGIIACEDENVILDEEGSLTITVTDHAIREAVPQISKYVLEDDYARKEESDADMHTGEDIFGKGAGIWNDADNRQEVDYHLKITDLRDARGLILHDLLEKGLDFIPHTMGISLVDGETERLLSADDDYIVMQEACSDPNGPLHRCTFETRFSDSLFTNLSEEAYLMITYRAGTNTHAEDYEDYKDELLNHAYMTYSTDSMEFCRSDVVTTQTDLFGFGIYKYVVENGQEAALANAEFALERNGVYGTFETETDSDTGERYYLFCAWVEDPDSAGILTSDTDGRIRILGLDDDRYTVVETKAPEGCEILDEGRILTIDEDGRLVTDGNNSDKEVMTDHVINVENKKIEDDIPGTGTKEENNSPNVGGIKTGDHNHIGLWLILLVAAVAGVLAAFRMKKKS